MTDLNEEAKRTCGFLGCQRDAGDVDLTVAIVNDFGVAQEMQLRACTQHEAIVNAVSAAQHVTFSHGGGVSNFLDSVNWAEFKLYDKTEAELIRIGYL